MQQDFSYKSQFSQDSYLNENIFRFQRNGVFVDIGAHDGIQGSNTFFFEKELGWTGLAVEPILERYVDLVKNRSCVCMNCCVHNKNTTVDFTENSGYTEMLSGISETYDPRHVQRLDLEKKIYGGESKTVKKQAYTLSKLLELNDIYNIDYLSIDTEGNEKEILQGIDFSRFTIRVITVENNYPDKFSEIDDLLKANGFDHVTRLGGDEVYKLK